MIDLAREFLHPYVGVILLGSVFFLLAIRTPIGIALGLSALIATFIHSGKITSLVTAVVGAMNEKFLLTAIPFFILSSAFIASGGAAQRIVDFAVAAVGHMRGGMAKAGVTSCMLFAALSGSSPATVAAIGPIAIEGMRKATYPLSFAAGLIATSGTLGILIPPSIVMVVYAAATNESVGKMFLAGIIPGLLAGSFLILGIRIMTRSMGIQNMPRASWSEVFSKGGHAFFGLLLIVLILWGIYAGWFTPTEAAAFAAVYGFFIATFVYRQIGFLKDKPILTGKPVTDIMRTTGQLIYMPANIFHRDVHEVVLSGARLSIMLMFIIFNALLFSHVLTELRIPHAIATTLADYNLQPWVFLLCVNLILLIGGQFMEPSGLILVVAPVMHPIALQLGIDPIHLGIIIVVNMEIGMITPPVGLNLFVTSSITGLGVLEVTRAVLPWMLILFGFLLAITFIPQISLFLPDLLYNY